MDRAESPTFRVFRPITRWKDAILMTAYRKGIYGDSLKDLIGDELDDYAWRLGDYCKAMYSGDGLFYECKITAMFSNFCTVKFLGYDNTEDVRIEDLRETDGKQARREQIRIAKAILDENVDEDGDSSDLDDFLPMRMRRARQSAADGVVCADHSPGRICRASQSAADGAVCADHSHGAAMQAIALLRLLCLPIRLHGPPMLPQGPGPHAPPMLPQGTGPHAPPVMPQGTGPHAPPVMPQGTGPHAPPVMPQSPGPHAPPMLPQVPGIQSPPMLPQGPVPPNEMPGILNAWYMAGYYTGLHHAERGSHGCHCCRNHSNQRFPY
ncbi:Survival motor neuron protein like [Argiope bruennichi]|uniref:Survival motor neuron protein like n=1 Tax=Argiope bruennichi TaxID=94029 RepID=A0A8T0FMC2_ARGBR|nr:Survival motor neuron protein like [Argiope bruennichi]